ncbi:ABC transporter substrate-binding protein [Brachybacterium sp. AOP43-C2-M15]|uniref:ABC transporter substrate-binding protein n=1 Tax=Brachybacterium sp. AOP43-C2-M15 TaxID=3457661 RepID=UPI004034008F
MTIAPAPFPVGPRVSRAAFLAAGGLAGLLALGGCAGEERDAGGADGGGAGAEDGDARLPAAEGTTTYPLTLTTAWGETELVERPRRIAAVSPAGRDCELLAALGITPVVAAEMVERAVWTLEALPGEIPEIFPADHSGITPHETVAATEPDLIVVFGKSIADEFEQLSAIAPVLAATSEDAALEADWRTELSALGEALDLVAAADGVIADHDRWFESAREENPQFDGLSPTYVVQYAEEYGFAYFSSTGSDPEQLFLDLGFAPNPLAEQFVDDDAVSPEMLSLIDADVLVIGDNTGDDAELERLLTGQELFQQLEVVRDGHVAELHLSEAGYVVDGDEKEGNLAWALAQGGPLGKQWAAEQLIPILRTTLAP